MTYMDSKHMSTDGLEHAIEFFDYHGFEEIAENFTGQLHYITGQHIE